MLIALLPMIFAPPLTQGEVFGRMTKTYNSLKTLKVQVRLVNSRFPASANIWFSRPDRLRVTGQTTFKTPYDLLIDGKERWLLNSGIWSRVVSTEMGISSITGISGLTGTTVPAMLCKTSWGGIILAGDGKSPAKLETVGANSAYRIYALNQQVWVDSKTFLIVRTYTKAGMFTYDARYKATVVGESIPESVFVKPKQ